MSWTSLTCIPQVRKEAWKIVRQAEGGRGKSQCKPVGGGGTERLPRAVKPLLGVWAGWTLGWLPQFLP